MNVISKFSDEYDFLSNFYESPVTYEGFTYRNSEAAYQAQKCSIVLERVKFTTLTAHHAKKLGRSVNIRLDWENVKADVMFHVVLSKFEQNTELAHKLMQTGDAYLEEGNTWGDTTWGTVNGQGQNLLGKILMDVRRVLKERNIE